jgi:gliding motility-associated-like protein
LKRLFLILLLVVFCHDGVKAAHLVGGEISYRCLGNHNYEITLTIYRDCFSPGAPFDSAAAITIFNPATNAMIMNLQPVPISQSTLPVVAPNNCTTLPNNVCTEKAVYRTTVNLPPSPTGYTITHQRCCRNMTINNIPSPDIWGNTYTIDIPPNDNACNSSPRFNADPPVVLCLNQRLNLNLSATESDGDSLYYQLCSPLHGGGQDQSVPFGINSPRPNPAAAPPYGAVPFIAALSPGFPLPSSPALSINPSSGILTGTPTQIGQFVFAICVEEYRNGVLLSTLRRDFQFNISGSCQAVISRIEPQNNNPNNICSGKTISFNEDCINANSYYWDFGDPSTATDISTDPNPTYTYANFGTYTIMLVANPNTACADTSYEQFITTDPISARFQYNGDLCFDTHSVNFTAQGNFGTDATFNWNFGGATSSGNPVEQNPANVRWTSLGGYLVTLTVRENGCTSTFQDSIYVYPAATLRHKLAQVQLCSPSTLLCTDSSITYGRIRHIWDFGDGSTSSDPSPTHLYLQAGQYTVSHTLISLQGCKDTLVEVFPVLVDVLPSPRGFIDVHPPVVSIFDPFVTVRDTSNQVRTETYIPGRGRINDLQELTFKVGDTGTYNIVHISFNEFGCTDTVVGSFKVKAPLNFYVPNAFTPNGDGTNDYFKLSVTGVHYFVIHIYDRWGKKVFESDDQNYSWNGKMNNVGTAVPIGYYTYLIEVVESETSLTHRKQGTIALLR